MKKNIIITADKITALLLQKVIPTSIQSDCKIFVGAGDVSAISMARSAAVLDYEKIVLVLNVSQKNFEEKENSATEILNLVFTSAEIKIKGINTWQLLVLDREFLENLFGLAITFAEYELYLIEPEYALRKISNKTDMQEIAENIINNMSENLKMKILNTPAIQEIVNFLQTSFAYKV